MFAQVIIRRLIFSAFILLAVSLIVFGATLLLPGDAARAILGQSEVRPDVDRVIAVYPDGRAFGWQQINDKTPERGVMD